jgi:redox-sensitive bicupin YhaK (pirin superfamily)
MKALQTVYRPPQGHWVGDGFPVRSLFSYDRMGAERVSPFLLLDYAGPAHFEPADVPRGVGQHPHRGFETVTLIYQGELAHRDSSGGGGVIGEGDVQWMTAGAGIVHEEFHSPAFTRQGGTLEMVQLWVNLPAAHKDEPAHYQSLLNRDIPRVQLEENGGELRVIAGNFRGHEGPARTFSPMNVWDARLDTGSDITLPVPDGHTTLLVVLSGAVRVNGDETANEAELVSFQREGESVRLEALAESRLLLLSGQPLDEPVAGYGPFVMNSPEEIRQTIADFRSGNFGAVAG